jgi:hypothetical protein
MRQAVAQFMGAPQRFDIAQTRTGRCELLPKTPAVPQTSKQLIHNFLRF